MTRSLSRSVLCASSLLCVSALAVRADEVKAAPSLSTGSTISLLATSSKSDVAAFLKTPVSFTVKDASFLSAFDAVLAASGKTCSIECRQMKPMKLNFGAMGDQAGSMLDNLAKAGGGSLYILPDKLLLSSPALLTDEEKKTGKPYSVLLSGAMPQGKTLAKQPNGIDIVAIANTKVSCSIENQRWGQAAGMLMGALPYSAGGRKPFEPLNFSGSISKDRPNNFVVKDLSLSFQDVPLGEALGMIAHMNGCELYLLPGKFLMCPANDLTPDQQKVAVPAFQYPGIGSSAPSGSKS